MKHIQGKRVDIQGQRNVYDTGFFIRMYVGNVRLRPFSRMP